MLRCVIVIWFFMYMGPSCTPQSKIPLHEMTDALWEEDILYLNRRIQKEFATFDPAVKSQFEINASKLIEELGSIGTDEVMIKIGQLLAGLGDGHTEMSLLEAEVNFDRLPLILHFFEEGLYIVGAHEPYRHYISSQIIKFGDKTVDQAFAALKTVMTHDNDYEILHAGRGFLLMPQLLKFLGMTTDPASASLTLMTKDSSHVQQIPSYSIDDYTRGPWVRYWEMNDIERPLYAQNRSGDNWYEYIDTQKTMYFHYGKNNNQKGQPSIKKIVKRMFDEIDELQVEKLVIDMRMNRGGNYHKSRPLIKAITKRPELNKDGRIYAITGRTTFSAAMVTSIFLKKETNTILVGEPSRGHPNKADNVEHLNLPYSGLRIEYTTKVKQHWPELGALNHVPVDHEVRPTYADFAVGRDAALEYIFNQ